VATPLAYRHFGYTPPGATADQGGLFQERRAGNGE